MATFITGPRPYFRRDRSHSDLSRHTAPDEPIPPPGQRVPPGVIVPPRGVDLVRFWPERHRAGEHLHTAPFTADQNLLRSDDHTDGALTASVDILAQQLELYVWNACGHQQSCSHRQQCCTAARRCWLSPHLPAKRERHKPAWSGRVASRLLRST